MDLRTKIQQLASQFALSVLEVIRQTSLDELLGEKGALEPRAGRPPAAPLAPVAKAARVKSSARLPRRSADDIASTVTTIVALLKKHKGGLRAEQIRDKLGLASKEMPRPLAQGVKSRAFKKKGQKRATTYFIS